VVVFDAANICRYIHTSIINRVFTENCRFEPIEDSRDTNCIDPGRISHESTKTGTITSIGLEENCVCPQCFSVNIESNHKTNKCNNCKSRSLYSRNAVDENNLIKKSFRKKDLIEQEDVLVALASINVCVHFNTKSKHINSIVVSERVN
jgi:hypothetical protein